MLVKFHTSDSLTVWFDNIIPFDGLLVESDTALDETAQLGGFPLWPLVRVPNDSLLIF